MSTNFSLYSVLSYDAEQRNAYTCACAARHRSLYLSPPLCACLTESEVCLYAPVSLNLHCVFGGMVHIFGLVLTNDGRNQMCFPFRILTLWLAGFFDGDFDVALPTSWLWIAVVSMSLVCCTEEAS